MLHHGESPEKPQYMATPPFLHKFPNHFVLPPPLVLAKIFAPPIFINFGKVKPPFMKGDSNYVQP